MQSKKINNLLNIKTRKFKEKKNSTKNVNFYNNKKTLKNNNSNNNNSNNNRNVFIYWIGKEYKLISIIRNLIYLHSTNGIGYNLILITDKNICDYIDNIPRYFYDLCPAHQADFVRVHVICDYGGIWLDSDTLVLDSLDSLFDIIDNNDGFFIKENNYILWNGIFGSKKKTSLMEEWKIKLRSVLDMKKNTIDWSEIGSTMLESLNSSLFKNYKIFQGLNNMYPVNWNNCVAEFITKPYDNYKNIIRDYQPLVVLVQSVYKELENKSEYEILNGTMPINYFINKSFENMGISKNKLNNGYQIYNYSDKDYISRSIINYETWEPNITCLMNNIINKNEYSENQILDIGCHIGYFSLITQKFNSISHVYSIDANNININLLKLSCSINNISNITLINNTVSDKSGKFYESNNIELVKKVNNSGGLSYKKSKNKTNVVSITIDELIAKNKITNILIMKMDIEGGELNALKGATKYLKTDIIKNIIIEITPKFNNNSKTILDILYKNDYNLYNIPSEQETGYFNTDNNLLENIKSNPIKNISEFISSIPVQTNVLAIKNNYLKNKNNTSKITYSKVIINTVAKVGSANFLYCRYSQSKDIHHTHSLLILQDTLNKKSNCLIIVGVRNPIDRNLSYLFQTYNDENYNDVKTKKNNYKGEKCYIPEIYNKTLKRYERTEVIIDLYFKQKYHNTFNEWFEEFLDITKISNFDKDKGVSFYKFPNNNTIMIYTMEKLTVNYKYIKEQLGIVSDIENTNNSDNRAYYEIYNEVKQKIVYKKEYLDNLLNTDIMRFFYNKSDINFFYSKYKTL